MSRSNIALMTVAGIAGAMLVLYVTHVMKEERPTDPSNQLSAEACETALILMSDSSDQDGAQAYFGNAIPPKKQCEETTDRMALIKSYINDKRLARMIEATTKLLKNHEVADQSANCRGEKHNDSELDIYYNSFFPDSL